MPIADELFTYAWVSCGLSDQKKRNVGTLICKRRMRRMQLAARGRATMATFRCDHDLFVLGGAEVMAWEEAVEFEQVLEDGMWLLCFGRRIRAAERRRRR